MKVPLLIDQALLDSVSLEACRSPRQRKNRNFHSRRCGARTSLAQCH
jgi:hypothetical protein